MDAGKTKIQVGTKIRTTKQWDEKIITGTITHPFGCFGVTPSTIAGIEIDTEYHAEFGEIGNLFKGDFEIIERYFCDVCNDTFEGEPGKHVNDVHGEEYHSSESMIDFEERHISEVD